MTVIDTTNRTKEQKEKIDKVMGKSFSFMQTLKMKGKGSRRMIIEEVSNGMGRYLSRSSDLSYGSIELRPNGILVIISTSLRFYSWLVPYYKLYLYKTKGVSIHADGQFVRFRDDRLLRENSDFFKKVMAEKSAYDVRFPSTGNGQLTDFPG